MNPPRPEPVAEGIHEGREVGRRLLTLYARAKLPGLQRLDARSGQGHRLDAEAGVDPLQSLGEELCQAGRVTARPCRPDPHGLDAAIDAVEQKIEPPCAGAQAGVGAVAAEIEAGVSWVPVVLGFKFMLCSQAMVR